MQGHRLSSMNECMDFLPWALCPVQPDSPTCGLWETQKDQFCPPGAQRLHGQRIQGLGWDLMLREALRSSEASGKGRMVVRGSRYHHFQDFFFPN